MRKTAALVAAMSLVGCATEAKFAANMNSWIGAPESRLVSRWGPPTSSYAMADGSRVLSYAHSSSMVIGGGTMIQPVTTNTYGTVGSTPIYGTSTTYQPVQQPAYNVQMSCTVNFTIDTGGMIQSWSSYGNACRAQ